MNNNMENTEGNRNEVMPLDLNVRVRPITPRENLIGFAAVTVNNSFVVEGIKVCSGPNGLFINMPATQDANGRWHDICKPITADFRRQLTEAVVDGYGAAIEKMQATLDAAKDAHEKPSVTGALRENADRVKAQQPAKVSVGKHEQTL